jgi:SlyX protein
LHQRAERRRHLSDRVDDLEIKLAFQDKLIQELSDLVKELGARLDETVRDLAQLKEAIRSPESPLAPGNERPPHY